MQNKKFFKVPPITSKEDIYHLIQIAKDSAVDQSRNCGVDEGIWWLGYASALKDIAKALDETAIYQNIQKEYRMADAVFQLAEFYDINFDEDAEELNDGLTACAKEMGANFEELINPESHFFILDALTERFEKAADCNIAENDTWKAVIKEFIKDGGAKAVVANQEQRD